MKNRNVWLSLPIIGFIVSEWQFWRLELTKPCFRLAGRSCGDTDLRPYAIDMYPLLALPFGNLDEAGVPYNAPYGDIPALYHPTSIAQYALAHWNAYLAKGGDDHKDAFMTQAYWLLAHQSYISEDAGGWPIPFPAPDYHAAGPWLSALTQGNGISVLVRAYQLTGEDAFLHAARHAVRTFELDILDGGVSASVGDDGIFFEEVAAYPAAHVLNGYILAIFGLYDYVACTGDAQIAALIQRSLDTFHSLIDEFDTGYWTRYDLLHRNLAVRFYHALHVILLEALARYSGCQHCAALATQWDSYQQRRSFQARSLINILCYRYSQGLQRRVFSRIPGARAKPGRTADIEGRESMHGFR